MLLTLHKKLRMWLQMGGHCEPAGRHAGGRGPARGHGGVGHRGADPAPGRPVRLDRHPIPPPCHWHFDVQYAVVAPPGAVQAISDESLDLRWFAYDEVATVADDSVVRLLKRPARGSEGTVRGGRCDDG